MWYSTKAQTETESFEDEGTAGNSSSFCANYNIAEKVVLEKWHSH